MSSPLELFRRNLKPMMVFLTLVALFSFVVLPSVAMYQQQRLAANSGPTSLATFKGGEYDANQVQYFTRNHFATLQVLQALAEATMARGGAPNVADFNVNPQTKQIMSLGINSTVNERSSIDTMRFAKEARDLGLELDDIAIRQWLSFYTDGRFSDTEINGFVATETRNQLGISQFYEQLRTQLLAQAFRRHWFAGLSAGTFAITPPAQQWELFLRINRRAVADAYAVNVSEFIDKTNPKPAENLVRETFELGKDEFPLPDSAPKPAFRRPAMLNVEYLAGDLNQFIQNEAKNFTEEQLRAEYQRRLDGGDFKLPEELKEELKADAAAAPGSPAADAPAAAETPAADSPASDTPATESKDAAEPPMTEEKADAAAAPEPAAEKPADEPAPAPAEQPAAEPSAPAAETKPDAPAADTTTEGEAEPAKPEGGESSKNNAQPSVIRLVSAVQADGDAPAEDKPAEETPAEDKPAEQKPAEETPAEDKPAETPAADAEPEAAKTETPAADMPAEAKPATETPATETPATETPVEPAKPKVEPFESVRDQIAASLAEPVAVQKLNAAITEVDKVMRTYFNARAIAGKDTSKVPPKPDLKALAEKLGMKHVVTGMVDARELQDDPIGFSRGPGSQFEAGEPYVQIAFGPRSQLFSSIRTDDPQSRVSYVSWKIEEQKDFIPTLEQAREDVVTYLRTVEARELARAEAVKLSKQFASSDKPVKELVPEERKSLLFESIGPFSWMTSFGFGMRAFMSEVPELDRVGEQFMRQVFTSERNEWGVAPNEPESVFYVVRPTEFSPSTDELHQRFAQPMQRFLTNSISATEASQILQDELETLDKRTGFKFNDEALQND